MHFILPPAYLPVQILRFGKTKRATRWVFMARGHDYQSGCGRCVFVCLLSSTYSPERKPLAALTVHAFCSAYTVYMTALCPLWNTVFWGVTTDQTGHCHQSGLPSEDGLIENTTPKPRETGASEYKCTGTTQKIICDHLCVGRWPRRSRKPEPIYKTRREGNRKKWRW